MGTDRVIRIVIADDHAMFRDAMKRLLETEQDLTVVGEAGEAGQTVRLAQRLLPDVLLLDMALEGGSGLDVLRSLAAASPAPIRTMVLTAGADTANLIEALQLGARGIIFKHSASALLFKCIRCVMQGEFWLGRNDVGNVVEAMQRLARADPKPESKRFNLTPREMQIVQLVAGGNSNKGIAERLSIREDTVKHHLVSIFDKLGVYSRLELAMFAVNHRLVQPERLQAS